MPEPQIQYTRTSDGVTIAYITTGDGPPVLSCAFDTAGMQSTFSDTAPLGNSKRELAASTRYTCFDHAGIGASQRDVNDFSLEAQVRAIEAVAACLADQRLTLIGWGTSSASAALYAARHAGRIGELVCVDPAFSHAGRFAAEIRDNWSLARRRWAGVMFPEGPVSSQRWWSNAIRDATTADVVAAYHDEFAGADLKEIYRRISVPTLFGVPPAGPGREAALALASLVPGCRVTDVSDADDGAVAAILEFMGVDAAQSRTPSAASGEARGESRTPHETVFRTVLFSDIVGHTEMMQRLGDAKGRDVLREHERITRETLKAHGGTEVKTMGDGFMASFGSVTSAMDCAIALQRAFAAHTESTPEPLHVRVGLNAGEPIEEDGDLFGAAVILASRIAAKAGAGEILIPEPVRHLLSGKAFTFSDRGEHEMKGFDDAVRLYEVRWRE
jgi:class 3 adenylate cyclase